MSENYIEYVFTTATAVPIFSFYSDSYYIPSIITVPLYYNNILLKNINFKRVGNYYINKLKQDNKDTFMYLNAFIDLYSIDEKGFIWKLEMQNFKLKFLPIRVILEKSFKFIVDDKYLNKSDIQYLSSLINLSNKLI